MFDFFQVVQNDKSFFFKFKNLLVRKGIVNGQKQYQKFLIVTNPRCGSNYLQQLLNRHKNIICFNEEFMWMENKNTYEELSKIFRSFPRDIKCVGFKMMYSQPWSGKSKIWDILLKDPKIKIIHLRRKNINAMLISEFVALHRGKWFEYKKKGGKNKIESFRIDINRFKKRKSEVLSLIHEKSKQIENKNVFNLFYEDLIDKNIDTYTKIINFLGIEGIHTKPKVNLKVQRKVVKYDEIVENYKDLISL